MSFDKRLKLFSEEMNDLVLYKNTEQVFSYLLVHYGYLTANREGDKYRISIPNMEVRKEIERVVKQAIDLYAVSEDSECHRLLDYLHKKYHADGLFAIRDSDIAGLDAVFKTHPLLKCDSSNTYMNYFHLAAAVGDKGVFGMLKEKCHDRYLNSPDKLKGLTPFDYAVMTHHTDVTDAWDGREVPSIQKPGMLTTTLCNEGARISMGMVFATAVASLEVVVDLIVRHSLPEDYARLITKIVGINAVIHAAKWGLEQVVGEGLCKEYRDYRARADADPKTFKSLNEFKDYVLTHDAAYVSTKPCPTDAQELKKIPITFFNDPFFGTDSVTFHLCEAVPGYAAPVEL